MCKILSIEEFEYQMMLGSTNDSVVWGLGVVEWQPSFLLTPSPYISSSPFNFVPDSNSLYLQPRLEFIINENDTIYKKALEDEIKEMLTDGKSFWDLSTNNFFHYLLILMFLYKLMRQIW